MHCILSSLLFILPGQLKTRWLFSASLNTETCTATLHVVSKIVECWSLSFFIKFWPKIYSKKVKKKLAPKCKYLFNV